MLIKSFQFGAQPSQNVALRCPGCRNLGTFTPFFPNAPQQNIDVMASANGQIRQLLGQRKCPNPDCGMHVFVVLDPQTKLLRSYPVQRVDFDSANLF